MLSENIYDIIDEALEKGYNTTSILKGLSEYMGVDVYNPTVVNDIQDYIQDKFMKAKKQDDGMPYIPVLRRKRDAVGLKPDSDVRREKAFRGRI